MTEIQWSDNQRELLDIAPSFLSCVNRLHAGETFGPGLKINTNYELKQRQTKTVNSVTACWHQWSKKVRAHPAPLICFLTTPFLSPSHTLLTHSPRLSLFLPTLDSSFFSFNPTFVLSVKPHTHSLFLSLSFLLWTSPPFAAHVWCPPSDPLQLGGASESDIIIIIITGQETQCTLKTSRNRKGN